MGELYLPIGLRFPRSLVEVAGEFEGEIARGGIERLMPIPTGFNDLDRVLSGGVYPGQLVVLGGKPNVGKTILALQLARNFAWRGVHALVVCYEHDETHLLQRLLAMESFLQGGTLTLVQIQKVALECASRGTRQVLEKLLQEYPGDRRALEAILGYMERLYLAQGHPLKTNTSVLRTYVKYLRSRGDGARRVVLIVDYLQKVPPEPEEEPSAERVAARLKDLALEENVAVVAVSALDAAGIKGGRPGMADLWGGSLVKYEPDTVVMLHLQERQDGYAKVEWCVEKNRMGPAGVTLVHRLFGSHFCFDVSEEPVLDAGDTASRVETADTAGSVKPDAG